MKIDCGPTYAEIIKAKESWHEWYAWHPVRIGSRDCRWLETVERKGTFHCSYADAHWTWAYRPASHEIGGDSGNG